MVIKLPLTNHSKKAISIGVEPWGYYLMVEPQGQIVIETDDLETITYDSDSMAVWSRGGARMLQGETEICNYF